MKKILLIVSGILFSATLFAQKPTEGAPVSLEGTISGLANFGFGNSSATNLSATFGPNTPPVLAAGLRLRYFVIPQVAIRLSAGFNGSKTTKNFFQTESDNSGGHGVYTTKANTTTLGLGAEYHFKGTKKLSPYAGLDFTFGSGKLIRSGNQTDGVTWIAPDYSEKMEQKTTGFGVGLVAGTDYYFAENFYLGVELGLGFNSYRAKEGITTISAGGVTTETKGNEIKQSGFSNNVMGMFRIGWRF